MHKEPQSRKPFQTVEFDVCMKKLTAALITRRSYMVASGERESERERERGESRKKTKSRKSCDDICNQDM